MCVNIENIKPASIAVITPEYVPRKSKGKNMVSKMSHSKIDLRNSLLPNALRKII